MKIEHQIAVVTGAIGGIGLATSRLLVQRKVSGIALVDLTENCLQIAENLNRATNTPVAIPFCGDVCDSEFRQSVFRTMEEKFGPVSICIPAAGILDDALAVKIDKESGDTSIYAEHRFERIMKINMMHPTYWALETISGIAKYRHHNSLGKWNGTEEIQGVVVLIGSVSSKGNRGQVAYAGAKSGLVGVASTLNLEGLHYGVQTKIIHPGFVDTKMVDSIDTEFFEQNLKPLIGLGRKIQPEEIAELICIMIENPVLSGGLWADASMTPLA